MGRVGAFLILGLLAAGCTADQSTRVPLVLNSVAMMDMQRTSSILQKRRIASYGCRKAGYIHRTVMHRQCMGALIARDLQRTRERAERLTQQAAEQHGVCMAKSTFKIARCLEI